MMLAAINWIWALDGWIVAAAVLSALSCALLGNFMVLRRMSMMGDALSHAVLPGLAAAFLITGSRNSLAMLVGAAAVGILTALLTELIRKMGKVDESASMGVVFTSLFAVGLIMIRQAADHVDLDPGCVLYGQLEAVGLAVQAGDVMTIGPLVLPRVVAVLGIMFVANVAFVLLCYKELKLSSFDPALATSLGINAGLMHYLLMTFVAATTVASFEAIGNILVVAMLIVPAAAAHLLTERLGPMILVSLLIAFASGVLGHLSAMVVPRWFGYQSTITSGMMAAVAGLIFLLVLLVAPRHGIVSQAIRRARLSLRIVREDILGILYRLEEVRGNSTALDAAGLRKGLAAGSTITWVALRDLARRGQVRADATGYRLSDAGREEARSLLRSHRLWENYLVGEMNVRADHSHGQAERLEHVTNAAMQRVLSQVAPTELDPHGKPIPQEKPAGT